MVCNIIVIITTYFLKMKKVLFLCTGNSVRSIMSECLLNQLGKGKYKAFSAGSNPTGKVNLNSLKILKENNILCENAKSKSWDIFKKENFNYIVTVCNNAANETCPIYNVDSIKIHWDIEDPAAIKDEKLIEEKFKYVFNILKKKIKEEFLS